MSKFDGKEWAIVMFDKNEKSIDVRKSKGAWRTDFKTKKEADIVAKSLNEELTTINRYAVYKNPNWF